MRISVLSLVTGWSGQTVMVGAATVFSLLSATLTKIPPSRYCFREGSPNSSKNIVNREEMKIVLTSASALARFTRGRTRPILSWVEFLGHNQ